MLDGGLKIGGWNGVFPEYIPKAASFACRNDGDPRTAHARVVVGYTH